MVPIDGVSFHFEESVNKWTYVVLRRTVDELNISEKHQSCTPMIELIQKVGLMKNSSEVSPFCPRLFQEFIVNLPVKFNDPSADEFHKVHVRGVNFTISPSLLNHFLGASLPDGFAGFIPTPKQLAVELFGGTEHSWPSDGQLPAASLSVKYAILNKIGIANWYPSTHASIISTSLAQLIYLIGTGSPIDVRTFELMLLICCLSFIRLMVVLDLHLKMFLCLLMGWFFLPPWRRRLCKFWLRNLAPSTCLLRLCIVLYEESDGLFSKWFFGASIIALFANKQGGLIIFNVRNTKLNTKLLKIQQHAPNNTTIKEHYI
uniref:Putative plant transposon protein domain-containing protein n=1 Tax=Cucumis melo TaxID=3656 RepID=A0A9I9E876_CUCME